MGASMARLQLPDRSRSSLKHLIEYSEEQFRRLLSALESASRLNPQSVATAIVPPIRGSEEVVSTIFALHHAQATSDVTRETFLGDLIETMGLDPETPGFEMAKSRLSKVLSIGSLGKLAKASRVLSEYDHAFYDATIFSDIRPVFGDEASSPPAGMGIVHTLEILYHKDRLHERFFVALTTKDLQKLRSALDRAELKVTTLRESLAKAGIEYLEGE